MAQSALASGELGQHNGLPVTIVVTTTLQDLESAAGHAVTGGGTRLPMRDVIRLASHAHHYLCIYDKHTSEPLYLGRTKRLASKAQRIVLYGLERGLHPARLHRTGVLVPGTPHPRLGRRTRAHRHQPAHPDLPTRQPARRTGLDRAKTQRRPHRMDPTTPPRHRPNPSQQLPPPREVPASTRTTTILSGVPLCA